MKILQSLDIAISMYSKIPVPQVEWTEENMKYAMCFFPVIGIITGIAEYAAGTFLLASGAGILFCAVVLTLLPVLITGGIHMDGFLDTMDALSSYGDREKKLAILKDSNSGAFAVIAMGCYLLWNMAVWSEATVEMLPVIAAGYVLSRGLSGLSVVTFPAAKESGLARMFQDRAQKKVTKAAEIIWILLAGVFMTGAGIYAGVWQAGAAGVAAAILIFVYYRQMSIRQFGGITGDLAGYFLQICELTVLTVIVGGFHICG